MSLTYLFLLLFIVTFVIFAFFTVKYLRKPKTAESMSLDDRREATISDHRITYYQKGKGPHLLLIHGHGSSAYCWSDIYADLAKNFTVTALDLPGFGLSEKHPDQDYGYKSQIRRLNEFCKELNIQQCFIVGCSMGGALAIGLAIENPTLIQSVAVISPAINPRLTTLAPRRALWFVKNFGHHLATPYLVEKMASRVFINKEKLGPKYLEHYYSTYHQSPDAVICFWKALDSIRDFPYYTSLSRLKQPILLMFGEQDKVTPWKSMRTMQKQIPQLKTVFHAQGGHHLMEDEPDFVLSKITNFFGST